MSQRLNLSEWASSLTGIPGDIWTGLQFDMALTQLGMYVESKLNELDENAKPVYRSVEDILRPPKRARSSDHPQDGWNELWKALGYAR